MAEVTIPERLWLDFVAVARRRGRKAHTLAQKVLRDYVQRIADEELLARSEHAARRAPFRSQDTEEVIRKFRRKGKKS